MKKLLLLIFAILIIDFASAQTNAKTEISYKTRRGTIQLYYGDLKISYARAKELCLDNGYTKAFEDFKRAKKIRNWDIVWNSLGTINVIQGSVSGNLLTLSTGAVFYCIPLLPSRGKRFVMYTRNGVEAFNSGE